MWPQWRSSCRNRYQEHCGSRRCSGRGESQPRFRDHGLCFKYMRDFISCNKLQQQKEERLLIMQLSCFLLPIPKWMRSPKWRYSHLLHWKACRDRNHSFCGAWVRGGGLFLPWFSGGRNVTNRFALRFSETIIFTPRYLQ